MARTEFSTLKETLADRLGEDNSSYPSNLRTYSDNDITTYINKAYNDFLKRTGIYVETKTDLSADANGYYVLPSEVNSIISIYYDGNELEPKTNKELRETIGKDWRDVSCATNEKPDYVIWENNYTTRSSQEIAFTIAKKPDTYDDIEINYIPEITLSADADTMIIPEGAEECVLLYAEALAYRKDDIEFDYQFSQLRYNEYLRELQLYISEKFLNKKIIPLGNQGSNITQQMQQGGGNQ